MTNQTTFFKNLQAVNQQILICTIMQIGHNQFQHERSDSNKLRPELVKNKNKKVQLNKLKIVEQKFAEIGLKISSLTVCCRLFNFLT